MLTFSPSFKVAPPACACGTVTVGTNPIERVAALSNSLTGMPCRCAIPPKDVHLVCHDFHVVGVHASTDTAKVVNDQTYWNPAYAEFVGPPMGVDSGLLPMRSPVAISITVTGQPNPTAISKFNLRPKRPDGVVDDTIELGVTGDGTLSLHRKITPFVAMPSDANTSRGYPFINTSISGIGQKALPVEQY